MTIFRLIIVVLIGITVFAVTPSPVVAEGPVEWGFTLGAGGAQAFLNPNEQPWAVGYDLRFGWDLRMTTAWRVSVFVERRRFFNDTTTTAKFKFPDPVAKSSQAWTSTAFNFCLRRVFRPQARLKPYLLGGGGLTTWEITDYATGDVVRVLGGNNKETDYKASEWHTTFGAGLELGITRTISIWSEFDFHYLSGLGTSFARSVDDFRSRGSLNLSFGLIAYFGGSRQKPNPQQQETTSNPATVPEKKIEEDPEISITPPAAQKIAQNEQTEQPPDQQQPASVTTPPRDMGDDDNDGVPNADDRCPHTPLGTPVNADGCPPDTDGDGVLDLDDLCPETPRGAPIDEGGCALDTDSDGIIDLFDQCAETPVGAAVDEIGCPTDGDGDGILDGLDQCPDTEPHLRDQVDPHGCAADTDGDGIADYFDNCPDTPPGVEIDSLGCIPDSDGDGVPNHIDRCPDSPPGLAVDETGCLTMTQLDRKLLLFPDYEAGVILIDRITRKILDDLAIRLNAEPAVTVYIRAYTDNIGEADANKAVAQRRADQARDYLIERGVAQGRVVAIGLGEVDFIADNANAAGRKRNRRLEFSFER
jgi:flagellar motor protein MotB